MMEIARAVVQWMACEHGNNLYGPMKDWDFLDQQSDYNFLKKDSGPWSQDVTGYSPRGTLRGHSRGGGVIMKEHLVF
jgi:hypothetical protein